MKQLKLVKKQQKLRSREFQMISEHTFKFILREHSTNLQSGWLLGFIIVTRALQKIFDFTMILDLKLKAFSLLYRSSEGPS